MRNRFDTELENLNLELIKMGSLIETSIETSTKALINQDLDLIKKVNIWRNSKKLLSEFKIYVMDRYESGIDKTKFNHLVFLNTPVFECSSTDVRNNILKGVSVDNMIPIEIEDYIKNNKIY